MSEYEKQAEKFLKDTETTLKAEFLRHGVHFEGETEQRDIYEITLTKEDRVYKFEFGQSIAHSGFNLINPNNKFKKHIVYSWFNKLTYNEDRNEDKLRRDIAFNLGHGSFGFSKNITPFKLELGLIPSAYDVLACLDVFDEDFKEFCDSFGYEEDSRTALKIFKTVEEQTKQLKIIWDSSDIEKLQEIQ